MLLSHHVQRVLCTCVCLHVSHYIIHTHGCMHCTVTHSCTATHHLAPRPASSLPVPLSLLGTIVSYFANAYMYIDNGAQPGAARGGDRDAAQGISRVLVPIQTRASHFAARRGTGPKPPLASPWKSRSAGAPGRQGRDLRGGNHL